LPVPTNSVHTRRSPSAHPPLGAQLCTRHGSTAAYTLDTPTNAAGRHDLPCHLTPAQQREVIPGPLLSPESNAVQPLFKQLICKCRPSPY
jgi:hypothetical protein